MLAECSIGWLSVSSEPLLTHQYLFYFPSKTLTSCRVKTSSSYILAAATAGLRVDVHEFTSWSWLHLKTLLSEYCFFSFFPCSHPSIMHFPSLETWQTYIFNRPAFRSAATPLPPPPPAAMLGTSVVHSVESKPICRGSFCSPGRPPPPPTPQPPSCWPQPGAQRAQMPGHHR